MESFVGGVDSDGSSSLKSQDQPSTSKSPLRNCLSETYYLNQLGPNSGELAGTMAGSRNPMHQCIENFKRIDRIADVSPAEKTFMTLWNANLTLIHTRTQTSDRIEEALWQFREKIYLGLEQSEGGKSFKRLWLKLLKELLSAGHISEVQEAALILGERELCVEIEGKEDVEDEGAGQEKKREGAKSGEVREEKRGRGKLFGS